MLCPLNVPKSDMGDLKTMHDATMMTTLFKVLATLCVTGPDEGEGEKGGKEREEEKEKSGEEAQR